MEVVIFSSLDYLALCSYIADVFFLEVTGYRCVIVLVVSALGCNLPVTSIVCCFFLEVTGYRCVIVLVVSVLDCNLPVTSTKYYSWLITLLIYGRLTPRTLASSDWLRFGKYWLRSLMVSLAHQ